MAQTYDGRIKQFCRKSGIEVEFYKKQVEGGMKWCTGCKKWHTKKEFKIDKSRYDGLSSSCSKYRKLFYSKTYKPKPRPEKGRVFVVPRDGDKKQARRRINYLVEQKIIPHPNEIKCTDCGHTWEVGQRRHEYDHYVGYQSESHYLVESVCTICHKKRHKNGNNNGNKLD